MKTVVMCYKGKLDSNGFPDYPKLLAVPNGMTAAEIGRIGELIFNEYSEGVVDDVQAEPEHEFREATKEELEILKAQKKEQDN